MKGNRVEWKKEVHGQRQHMLAAQGHKKTRAKDAATWQRRAGQAETGIKRGEPSFAGIASPWMHEEVVALHDAASLYKQAV